MKRSIAIKRARQKKLNEKYPMPPEFELKANDHVLWVLAVCGPLLGSELIKNSKDCGIVLKNDRVYWAGIRHLALRGMLHGFGCKKENNVRRQMSDWTWELA